MDWNDLQRRGWKPHPSHDWGRRYSTIIRAASDDRFASSRECRACGAEVISRGDWESENCDFYADYDAGTPCPTPLDKDEE